MRPKPIIPELDTVTGYMQTGQGLVLGMCEKDKPLNVLWVDEDNARADFVYNFLDTPEQADFDFIRAFNWIRKQVNPIETVKKLFKGIKEGGYLLVIENNEPDPNAKHYFNFNEMEGLLRLFEDYGFIEASGQQGKIYFYVVKKKKEVTENEIIGSEEVISPEVEKAGCEQENEKAGA